MHTEGVQVAISVLFMSMSLDGYIAGPDDDIDHPGGKGFDRLHASGDAETILRRRRRTDEGLGTATRRRPAEVIAPQGRRGGVTGPLSR
jgi:hypothetical protein